MNPIMSMGDIIQSFYLNFQEKNGFFNRHEHSEQELKEHKEIFDTYDLNKVVFIYFENGFKNFKKI